MIFLNDVFKRIYLKNIIMGVIYGVNYHYLYLFIIGVISVIYHFLNSNFHDKSLFIIKYFGIFLIYLFTFNSLLKLFN